MRAIEQNKHLRKTSCEYLFQGEDDSCKLLVFCIPKKQLKTLGFPFVWGMGFYHVGNSLYIGGGVVLGQFFSQFNKLLPNG